MGRLRDFNVKAELTGIDIEVSRQHKVSVSDFQGIEVSTDDRLVNFEPCS